MKMPPTLYVHIPFCQKKCAYCSFAIALAQMKRRDEYVKAIAREAEHYPRCEVASLYIGGGTPSSLEPDSIRELVRVLRQQFTLSAGGEVTFEVNPESVDDNKARALQECGINRVSLGIQSLHDHRLQYLARSHSRNEAMTAFCLLRDHGFVNVNIDLMYGFPGQSDEELREDLDQVLSLGSEHLSIYSLTVEQRSLFFAKKVGVDNQAQARAYELICREVQKAGLRQYEISNFARPGFESKHNMNYWRGGEYIGLGMAAHSHLDGRRFWNADTLPLYLGMITQGGQAQVGEEKLGPVEKLTETFLFGLRMNEGVDLEALERTMGVELSDDRKEALENFIEMGFLEEFHSCIRATDRGRLVLDEISARLV
jgi:oxygen-independent coproporphyrinogen-3 oxidase